VLTQRLRLLKNCFDDDLQSGREVIWC
jgi:hypothetical protein